MLKGRKTANFLSDDEAEKSRLEKYRGGESPRGRSGDARTLRSRSSEGTREGPAVLPCPSRTQRLDASGSNRNRRGGRGRATLYKSILLAGEATHTQVRWENANFRHFYRRELTAVVSTSSTSLGRLSGPTRPKRLSRQLLARERLDLVPSASARRFMFSVSLVCSFITRLSSLSTRSYRETG